MIKRARPKFHSSASVAVGLTARDATAGCWALKGPIMTQDVTVTVDILLKPEAAEGFSRMGGEGLQATRDFPGCREVRIIRHNDDSSRFLFVERWENEEAYRNYIAWRTERGEFQGLQAMAVRIETNIWPEVIATT